jgi:hypothetical protein
MRIADCGLGNADFGLGNEDLIKHRAWGRGPHCHLASPSSSHYAALSFVLRGIGQTTDDSRQSTEDRREESQAG